MHQRLREGIIVPVSEVDRARLEASTASSRKAMNRIKVNIAGDGLIGVCVAEGSIAPSRQGKGCGCEVGGRWHRGIVTP